MENPRTPGGNQAVDLRVVKTLETIRSVFKDMLLEMDLSAITVTELCKRARINKKTFYRYYPALEYLLAELQDYYAVPYMALVRGLSLPDDVEEMTRIFLEYSVHQDRLYERITCSGPLDNIRETLIERVEDGHNDHGLHSVPAGWSPGAWELYVTFATRTPLQMYQTWVSGGKTVPVEQLVDSTVAAVRAGTKAYLHAMAMPAIPVDREAIAEPPE